MSVRILFAGCVAVLGALTLPAQAGGTVTVSPGHGATVKGHLQGVSPTALVSQQVTGDVCLAQGCDVTTVDLRLPKGKKGDLSIGVVSDAAVVGLSLRVYNAAGDVVGSTEFVGAGVPINGDATQSVFTVVRNLTPGRYAVQVSANAAYADFTESLKAATSK